MPLKRDPSASRHVPGKYEAQFKTLSGGLISIAKIRK
jgi:hypothetical protein